METRLGEQGEEAKIGVGIHATDGCGLGLDEDGESKVKGMVQRDTQEAKISRMWWQIESGEGEIMVRRMFCLFSQATVYMQMKFTELRKGRVGDTNFEFLSQRWKQESAIRHFEGTYRLGGEGGSRLRVEEFQLWVKLEEDLVGRSVSGEIRDKPGECGIPEA